VRKPCHASATGRYQVPDCPQSRRRTRRPLGGGLGALAAPCSCEPQPRPRCAHPPRASHARARFRRHHGPIPARKANRQFRPLSRDV